jgi:hypothetical protein
MGEQMRVLGKKALRISILFFLVLIVLSIGSVMYLASERGKADMKQSVFAANTVVAKPLIDTQVPKQTATATFAMG